MEQLAKVMVAQHKHQYRFFATYGMFRGWELAKGNKYEGNWSEGVCLYDEEKKKYEVVEKICSSS
ncbi:MAG: hypothetical protein LBG52_04630 [Candidatus Peribacteria bacterium]|jgi:hypothetical protein|nr:hypothetical protein [Candidatus Peribacteria bacterium]